jgi:hypothetical protein
MCPHARRRERADFLKSVNHIPSGSVNYGLSELR